MRGQGLHTNMVIYLILMVLIAAVAILFLMKVADPKNTQETQKISSECAIWISQSPPCKINKDKPGETLNPYPTLKKTYEKELDPISAAKKVCSCP